MRHVDYPKGLTDGESVRKSNQQPKRIGGCVGCGAGPQEDCDPDAHAQADGDWFSK